MFLQLTTEFQNTQAKPQGETYTHHLTPQPLHLNSRKRSSPVPGAFTKADNKTGLSQVKRIQTCPQMTVEFNYK